MGDNKVLRGGASPLVPAAASVSDGAGGVSLSLPWPPSVNHYWTWSGRRCFISKRGREYRARVVAEVLAKKAARHYAQRLMVFIAASPPDRRRRDLDNILKCLLDSMQHAGVFCDDSQVDLLSVMRLPNLHGEVVVRVIPVGTKNAV